MTSALDIAKAAEIIRSGGLVAIPTETVYGLGADALNPQAVARVFEVKQRPRFDPLIVHVADTEAAAALTVDFPATAQKLAAAFWPGPLTLVLPKRDAVPDIVTSGLPTVALRVPDHEVTQALLREAQVPIAAPSANPFGRLSPTTAEHVRELLGESVDDILDGGPCRVGVESTVVEVDDDCLRLLRPGGVTIEQLEAVVGTGKVMIPADDAHPSAAAQQSPGRLPHHYAPRTPLSLTPPAAETSVGKRVGLLCLRPPEDQSPYVVIEALSPEEDLTAAAAEFFAALRRLDATGLDLIVALPFPEHGLGIALNDRLRRAETRQ